MHFMDFEGGELYGQGRLHTIGQIITVATTRLTPWIQFLNSTSNSPTRTETKHIFNPIGPAGPQWINNTQNLKTTINSFFGENSGPRPSFSKVVGCKVTRDPRVDINLRGGMNFGSDSAITQNSNFVNFSIVSVNKTGKLGFASVATTRIGGPINFSD